MFASIQFGSVTSLTYFYPQSFLNALFSEPIQRVQKIAIAVFSRSYEFFNSFNKPSGETNLKTVAFISCLSLIALLVISMLRRRDSNLMSSTPS